jgi:hypothetical protein
LFNTLLWSEKLILFTRSSVHDVVTKLLKRWPCRGLVKKSASMSLVGQCSIVINFVSMWSLIKNIVYPCVEYALCLKNNHSFQVE